MSDFNKSDYWFFLSYARRDAKGSNGSENPWFQQFSAELARDVGSALGIPAAVAEKDIEFYDRDGIPAGADWDATLATALQSSKVFVCLYSPSYFNSEYCGKEFQVFDSRVQAYQATLAAGAESPRLIIPVLWESPDFLPNPLPEAVNGIQYADKSLGLEYAQSGLLQMMRMQQWPLYYQFLKNLVAKIRSEALAHSLPKDNNLASLKTIKSAFHLQTPPKEGQPPQGKGIKIAWLVYAVGKQADYSNVRQTHHYYGDNGNEWQPYLPEADDLIGYLASTVATTKGLAPENVYIDNNFIARLQEAEAKNTVVVIIVDPWSLKLQPFQQSLRAYDGTRLTNCGVVVLWNKQDKETLDQWPTLKAQLQNTFWRNLVFKEVLFQDEVCSVEELRAKLGAAIDEVKRRIYQGGRLQRGQADMTGEPFPKLPTGSAVDSESASTGGVK